MKDNIFRIALFITAGILWIMLLWTLHSWIING
jgi:hypothetical protein